MKRYIDADLADRLLTDGYGIDEIPSSDVAPVVHAHWIPKKERIRSLYAKNYNCSACGKESYAYPNCPFCRAIMDEEV